MSPGRWTELFFLDEVSALAAGHRPCAECRNGDFRVFQDAWRLAFPEHPVNADALDATLHVERRIRPWLKRTHLASGGALPDGTYVVLNERAWLVLGDELLAWSPDGYRERRQRPPTDGLTVLTPPSLVGVLRAGYAASVHPTASYQPVERPVDGCSRVVS
jgi:hypothetical protein